MLCTRGSMDIYNSRVGHMPPSVSNSDPRKPICGAVSRNLGFHPSDLYLLPSTIVFYIVPSQSFSLRNKWYWDWQCNQSHPRISFWLGSGALADSSGTKHHPEASIQSEGLFEQFWLLVRLICLFRPSHPALPPRRRRASEL